MKELFFDDDELVFDDPNIVIEEDGTFKLEPGDPGYVDPNPPPASTKKARKYMASNPTAAGLNELIYDGEKMCDGLHELGAIIGVKLNPEPVTRADLEDLKSKEGAFAQAQSAEGAANGVVQAADAEASRFISLFIGWMSLIIGSDWSDNWLETGLPDTTVGVPRTMAKRFATLGKIGLYLTNHPEMEVNHPKVVITAARAQTLYTAYSDAEDAADTKTGLRKTAKNVRDGAARTFRNRYRKVIDELGQLLGPEDGRWAVFGLSRPADPETAEAPRNLVLQAGGGGLVIAKLGGARRANSFNFYKLVVGVDPAPVKVINSPDPECNIPGLPVGSTVQITATGVNDAGEGPACDPVSIVVT